MPHPMKHRTLNGVIYAIQHTVYAIVYMMQHIMQHIQCMQLYKLYDLKIERSERPENRPITLVWGANIKKCSIIHYVFH